MKKTFAAIVMMACASVSALAQDDVQKAAQEAAAAFAQAPVQEAKPKKPNYWTNSLKTQINIGQTGLTNWAAGGDNTFTLAGYIDGNCNFKKKEMFWNNRLQLDMGLLYSSSKPLFQKSSDRIYFESKWGYKTESMKDFYFSANYDFKSQFAKGYDYKTPSVPDRYKDSEGNLPSLDKLPRKEQRELWNDARVLKSNFLAPAYTNLALGIDYTPTKWIAVNFAPITGGFVIVTDPTLRKQYGMKENQAALDQMNTYKESDEYKELDEKSQANALVPYLRKAYKSSRFEFGAQLKVDVKVNVNDNFAYSTQVVFFEDYLKDHKKYPCPRINWDNRVDWKLTKYFSFTIITNLIYDDMVMIKADKDIDKYPDGKARLQFKESLAFGFTYTIASKKN